MFGGMKAPATFLALAALAGCSQRNPDVCVATGVNDTSPAVREAQACIRKWGMKNASGPDDAKDVAEGLLSVCGAEIAGAKLEAARPDYEPDSAAYAAVYRRYAMFVVTNARAGHCWE